MNVNAQTNVSKIVIIDTGFNITSNSKLRLCKEDHKDFSESSGVFVDNIGHGTHISNIIGNIVYKTNYCAIIIKYVDTIPKNTMENSLNAFKYALTLSNVKAINYSSSGFEYSIDELDIISRLSEKNIQIFVAAGNHFLNLDKDCKSYPSCYNIKNVHVIGNLINKETAHPSSNYGSIVTEWEIGTDIAAETSEGFVTKRSGTSQATAIATSLFINRMK